MNLRVDLILDSERRSASIFSLKALTRMGSIVLPVLILFVIGIVFLKTSQAKREIKKLTEQWEVAEPRREEAGRIAAEYHANRAVLAELQGWRSSHIDWHAQLLGIMRETPPSLKFRSLSVRQAIQLTDQGKPSRLFTLSIAGFARGEQSEANVEGFRRRMGSAPAFAGAVQEATIPAGKFGKDNSRGASKFDRVFEIRCAYTGRPFE